MDQTPGGIRRRFFAGGGCRSGTQAERPVGGRIEHESVAPGAAHVESFAHVAARATRQLDVTLSAPVDVPFSPSLEPPLGAANVESVAADEPSCAANAFGGKVRTAFDLPRTRSAVASPGDPLASPGGAFAIKFVAVKFVTSILAIAEPIALAPGSGGAFAQL